MNKKNLAIIFCFVFTILNYGQNNTLIVKYKATINEKYKESFLQKIASKNISNSRKKMVFEIFNNTKNIEFILNVKNNESYYYYNPSLDIDGGGYNPTKALVSSMPYYTDNLKNLIIEINSFVGNISHKTIKWKVTTKTKKIGKYLCYQAIATEKSNNTRRGKIVDEKLIAWFTPEIPLNFGPKYYKGLPGLILEIEKKKFSIIAAEINLNPTKEIKIKTPNLDKIITKEESLKRYKEMVDDKKNN